MRLPGSRTALGGALLAVTALGCGGGPERPWDAGSADTYVQARSVWDAALSRGQGEIGGCAVFQAISSCRATLEARLRALDQDLARRMTTLAARDTIGDHCRSAVEEAVATFTSHRPDVVGSTVASVQVSLEREAQPGARALTRIWTICNAR